MDINNYSYTPYMLDEDNIKEYHNDDMYAEIYKSRSYDNVYYCVSAFSYDGQLEVAESCDTLNLAEKLFDYIVDNYSNTPPDNDTLPREIERLLSA